MDQSKNKMPSDQELMAELRRYREAARVILLMDFTRWKEMHGAYWLSRMQNGDQVILTLVRSDGIQEAIRVWVSMMPVDLQYEVVSGMQAAVMEKTMTDLAAMAPAERVRQLTIAREVVEAQLSRLDQSLASMALLQ